MDTQQVSKNILNDVYNVNHKNTYVSYIPSPYVYASNLSNSKTNLVSSTLNLTINHNSKEKISTSSSFKCDSNEFLTHCDNINTHNLQKSNVYDVATVLPFQNVGCNTYSFIMYHELNQPYYCITNDYFTKDLNSSLSNIQHYKYIYDISLINVRYVSPIFIEIYDSWSTDDYLYLNVLELKNILFDATTIPIENVHFEGNTITSIRSRAIHNNSNDGISIFSYFISEPNVFSKNFDNVTTHSLHKSFVNNTSTVLTYRNEGSNTNSLIMYHDVNKPYYYITDDYFNNEIKYSLSHLKLYKYIYDISLVNVRYVPPIIIVICDSRSLITYSYLNVHEPKNILCDATTIPNGNIFFKMIQSQHLTTVDLLIILLSMHNIVFIIITPH